MYSSSNKRSNSPLARRPPTADTPGTRRKRRARARQVMRGLVRRMRARNITKRIGSPSSLTKGGSSKRRKGATLHNYWALRRLRDQQEANAARTRKLMEWRGDLDARRAKQLSRRRRTRLRKAASRIMKSFRKAARGRTRRKSRRTKRRSRPTPSRRRTAGGSRRR